MDGNSSDKNGNYINLYTTDKLVNALPEKPVLHYPRLDTILMIEGAIKGAEEYPTKAELLRSLPKKIMYQTFNLVLDYLQDSKKVIVTKDGRVVWVFADSAKLRKLLSEGKRL